MADERDPIEDMIRRELERAEEGRQQTGSPSQAPEENADQIEFGTVDYVNIERRFGFIIADSGQKIHFRPQVVQGPARWEELRKGMRVSFEAIPGQRGPTAKWVVAGEQVRRPAAESQVKAEKKTSSYRFFNPYNFVRSLEAPKRTPEDPAVQLLGRCPPPSHDRYVGLTGKITCKLKNVTPLFISDSHGVEKDKTPGHFIYRFFQVENEEGSFEPAIPASSLRGMLRNIFEAATNSCYAHFDYDKRLSYHLPTQDALKLTPARVEKDEMGQWRLRLLPGTAQLVVGERPRDKLYPARVEQYEALSPGRRKGGQGRPPKPHPIDLNGLKHGAHCFALAENLSFPPVWQVARVSTDKQALDRACSKDQKVFEGYLCLNNQNIEPKRFERFFFDGGKRPISVPLSEDVRIKYEELIKDYRERHAKTIEQWKDRGWSPEKIHIEYDERKRPERKHAAFSRFIIGEPRKFMLKEGELVYAMLVGSSIAPAVQFIVPVAIPRVGYEHKVAHLLPSHLWKCEDYEQLCSACRTFGWVYGRTLEQPSLPKEKVTAYAGRLKFEHGQLSKPLTEEAIFEATLAILSSPKPTTSRFYLRPKDGKPYNGQTDFQAGYDNRNNVLRGRKVYRHYGHGEDQGYWMDKAREYWSVKDRSGRITKSDQNRTVQGVLKPGAEFTFEVSFENLAEVELGALLWSLEMEGKQFHRLGFAKPLGFGSVEVRVDQMHVVDMVRRYGFEAKEGVSPVTPEQRQGLVRKFKAAMQQAYGSPFDKLSHVVEILSLLGDPEPDLPIHYPRTDKEPAPDSKNFEWFMGNKRNKDARYSLELPGDEKGLPLIDRYGKEKN